MLLKLLSDRSGEAGKGGIVGWCYLSKATCLIRTHLCYACFVVSRSTMISTFFASFEETSLRDK